jgi:hypothetical protein
MRVVVGSEGTRDVRESELRRHLKMMSRFLDGAKQGASLTMILRSAGSDPAKTVIGLKGAMQNAGVSAKAILAKLDPDDELKQLFAALSELSPGQPASELIRWARNPRLLDAHEQVTYGDVMCWSGDAMRRDADKRNALALFDEKAPETVRLGKLAFAALWGASALVPAGRLVGPAVTRPVGAYEDVDGAAVSPSTLRPSLQGWPLVRH